MGETASVGAVGVTAVEARHDGRRRRAGGLRAETLGYFVRGRRAVYFAGDTELFDGMSALPSSPDVALLPVAGWGPTLGAGHMDPLDAARAARLIQPRIAIPMHWGTLLPIGLAGRQGGRLGDPPRIFAEHLASLAPEVEVGSCSRDRGRRSERDARVVRRTQAPCCKSAVFCARNSSSVRTPRSCRLARRSRSAMCVPATAAAGTSRGGARAQRGDRGERRVPARERTTRGSRAWRRRAARRGTPARSSCAAVSTPNASRIAKPITGITSRVEGNGPQITTSSRKQRRGGVDVLHVLAQRGRQRAAQRDGGPRVARRPRRRGRRRGRR